MTGALQGKTIFITGATDGIGKQTALELAHMGGRIVIHGRSVQRCENTVKELTAKTRNSSLDYICADLSSLFSVESIAVSLKNKIDSLDVLINNAGVYMKSRVLTHDGFEMTFAVNHVAHFYLTNLLIPILQKSTGARVITVSSIAHMRGVLDYNNLQAEQSFSAYGAYALSKLANVLFAYALADQLRPLSITSNALHPGVIATKLLREGFSIAGGTLEQGAATSVYLASAHEIASHTGGYYDNCKSVSSSPITYEKKHQQQLWDVTKKLVDGMKK